MQAFRSLSFLMLLLMNGDLNSRGGGGGGVTSIIKVYTDVQLELGILFRPPII